MSIEDEKNAEPLPRSLQLALNYAPPETRVWFANFFHFDALFGRIVAAAREPLIAQLRLAWWRDELNRSDAGVESPTPLLNNARRLWGTSTASLVALIDGWECLVADAIDDEAVATFCAGRAEVAGTLARLACCANAEEAVRRAAIRWSLAELAIRVAHTDRAEQLVRRAADLPRPQRRLPRAMAPMAVLDALARRSLKAGGRPLADHGMALIVAARAGQFRV